MTRITPKTYLSETPCSIVAVSSALNCTPEDTESYKTLLKINGYATLEAANKYIRANLDIKRRINYKRGQRPKLKNLHLDGKAVVCVYGHFVYLDHERYWSFFDNEDDDVVSVWQLRE